MENVKIDVKRDVELTRNFLKKNHSLELKSLQLPSPFNSSLQAVTTWGGMLITTYLCVQYSPWFIVLALIVFGRGQRVLNNIIHDASHVNCFRKRNTNDLFATIVACIPLFEDIRAYRKEHNIHHAYLGELHDPDRVDDTYYERNKLKSFFDLFRLKVTDPSVFRFSMVSRFGEVKIKNKLIFLGFWALFFILASALFGIEFGLAFIGLWLLSRATVFHCISAFTGLTDHAGLEQKTIYTFSRTLPRGLVSVFFYPHGDVYHLAHHLLPGIPISKLGSVDKLLMNLQEYRDAPRYNSYFIGQNSVIASSLRS